MRQKYACKNTHSNSGVQHRNDILIVPEAEKESTRSFFVCYLCSIISVDIIAPALSLTLILNRLLVSAILTR